jgi:xylan 1,4-beta-xylosidase
MKSLRKQSGLFILLFLLFTSTVFSQIGKKSTAVIFHGDFADPSIVRVGSDFYLTHSSYSHYPGLTIYHSKDLLHWEPVCRALNTNVGEVWAPEIIYYKEKYYIYFPTNKGNVYVITADKPEGPWSEPLKIDVKGIDPGHISGPDGQRYLYINDGRYIKISGDGLKAESESKKIYDGWKYPEDWAVECFCMESPKLFFYNNYYYLISALGGTSGPSTGHMAAVARSKSPEGPWENSPYNPLVHTYKADDRYVSKGHATLFEDGKGNWYAVYHAYENNHRPRGRNILLDAIEWTKDGWPKLKYYDKNEIKYDIYLNGKITSDDFSSKELKLQWKFSGLENLKEYSIENGKLNIDLSPDAFKALHCQPPDHNFEASVKIEADTGIEAGLTMMYDLKTFAGIGKKGGKVFAFMKGRQAWEKLDAPNAKYFKIKMDHYTLSMCYSEDGIKWINYPESLEVSGYQNNILGTFSFLKLSILGKGNGKLCISDFKFSPGPVIDNEK